MVEVTCEVFRSWTFAFWEFLFHYWYNFITGKWPVHTERLFLNDKTLGSLASRGDEFNLGPEKRLDRSELLCNKVLLQCKGDRESF